MQVVFRSFRAQFRPLDVLFAEVADFAGEIGKERLVSISHATERNEQVVTVWFWSEVPPPVAQKAERGRGFEVIVKEEQEES